MQYILCVCILLQKNLTKSTEFTLSYIGKGCLVLLQMVPERQQHCFWIVAHLFLHFNEKAVLYKTM